MTFVVKPLPAARSVVARCALWLAAFSACVTFYAFALTRLQAVDGASGLAALVAGLALAALAALLGVVALVVVWTSGAKGGGRAFAAIVIAAAVLGGPAYVAASRIGAPALVDVSTDLADPPRFERAGRDRGPSDLPAPPPVIPPAQAEAQRAGYPDIGPLRLALPANDVANLAIGLIDDRGWRLLGPTAFPRGGPPTGRIEAVARTPLLGLQNDVSIRIREDGEGARIDMRSASRIGRADFGANADRIRAFFADLTAAANATP